MDRLAALALINKYYPTAMLSRALDFADDICAQSQPVNQDTRTAEARDIDNVGPMGLVFMVDYRRLHAATKIHVIQAFRKSYPCSLATAVYFYDLAGQLL